MLPHPFRRGWSIRLGRIRIRSVPWYWDVLRERLAESTARPTPITPGLPHHDHYCEECDRRWVHEGETCALPWAVRCLRTSQAGTGPGGPASGRWLVVVRRDRAELGRRLGEAFELEPRVRVVLDRRQAERRGPSSRRAPAARERRRRGDRRAPPTGDGSAVWAGLGFLVQPDRFRDDP